MKYQVEFRGAAVLLKNHRRVVREGRVLGIETRDGCETVWLDRLLAKGDDEIDGWTHEGVISTILTRKAGGTSSTECVADNPDDF